MLTTVGKLKLRRTEKINMRYLYLPPQAFSKDIKNEGHLFWLIGHSKFSFRLGNSGKIFVLYNSSLRYNKRSSLASGAWGF